MTCWLCGFETTELVTNTRASVYKNGCQVCTAVAKVDEDINEAVTTLRRLLDKRRDLHTEQNRAHDPMHRLPIELRNRTFELVLPTRDEWGDTIQLDGELPTYLSSVCRSWRDIAWSNPFLWTTIYVPLGGRPSGWINFVHKRILHSGTLPLTFHIEAVGYTKRGLEQAKEDMAPVLDAMSHYSNRLQSLFLNVPLNILCAIQHDDFQWHRLTRLQIHSPIGTLDRRLPIPFLNPTASPEKIVFSIPTKSLQISWTRLTSATVQNLDLEDVTLLFQHASQMTECHVWSLGPGNLLMPPIIHHQLKTLTLRNSEDPFLEMVLLFSLTVPCLQEIHIDDMFTILHLPALVHQSSCPLTSLTLYNDIDRDYAYDDDQVPPRFEPLPGVTDIVVETLVQAEYVVIEKLLLEGCFPNLHHLTLRLDPFLSLWEMGVIPLLLDRKRLQSDGPNQGRLSRFLVAEQGRAHDFAAMWKTDVGERLMALGIRTREDGFEFL